MTPSRLSHLQTLAPSPELLAPSPEPPVPRASPLLGTELAEHGVTRYKSLADTDSLCNSQDMNARKQIIGGLEFAHVFFRCHNRQFLLEPFVVKLYFLLLLARYKFKYGVQIFEFNVMDNHVHMLVRAKTVEGLGHFMRTVNSLLARRINKVFDRDSQAIRERYKSPKIGNTKYLLQVMQYIWLNRFKETSLRPEQDPFCSVSWRLDHRMIARLTSNPKEQEALSRILDSYDDLPVNFGSDVKRFIRSMIQEAIMGIQGLTAKIFEHAHTIADGFVMAYRTEMLAAFRREHVPWTHPISSS